MLSVQNGDHHGVIVWDPNYDSSTAEEGRFWIWKRLNSVCRHLQDYELAVR